MSKQEKILGEFTAEELTIITPPQGSGGAPPPPPPNEDDDERKSREGQEQNNTSRQLPACERLQIILVQEVQQHEQEDYHG